MMELMINLLIKSATGGIRVDGDVKILSAISKLYQIEQEVNDGILLLKQELSNIEYITNNAELTEESKSVKDADIKYLEYNIEEATKLVEGLVKLRT